MWYPYTVQILYDLYGLCPRFGLSDDKTNAIPCAEAWMKIPRGTFVAHVRGLRERKHARRDFVHHPGHAVREPGAHDRGATLPGGARAGFNAGRCAMAR